MWMATVNDSAPKTRDRAWYTVGAQYPLNITPKHHPKEALHSLGIKILCLIGIEAMK